jgi:hypothetical protein
MATEFGESIKEDEYNEYKYINPSLKVYTDGGVASFNANENEWEDAKTDYQGYIKYWDKKLNIGRVEKKAYLVARAFIPNLENNKFIFYKDGNNKNHAVDNLGWGKTQKSVGYRKENDRFSVRMWNKEKQKVVYYGKFDTEEEAQAKVAEIKNINLKN